MDISDSIETINGVIEHTHEPIIELLGHLRESDSDTFKYSIIMGCEYIKDDPDNDDDEDDPDRLIMNFRSKYSKLHRFDDIASSLAPALMSMESNAEQFTNNGSNYQLQRILYVEVEVGSCFPLNASSCTLHTIIDNNRANAVNTLQIKKDDTIDNDESEGRCFFFAIASHFCPNHDNNKNILEEFIANQLQINIPWPVDIRHIEKFENANRPHLDLSINVIYKNEYGKIYPVYISKNNMKVKNVINLLLFHVNKNEPHTYEDTNIEISDSEPDDIDIEEEEKENQMHNPISDNIIAKSTERHYALINDLDKVITKSRIEQIHLKKDEIISKKEKQIKRLIAECEGTIEPNEHDIQRSVHEKKELIKKLKKEIDEVEKSEQEKIKKYNYGRAKLCYNCFSVFTNNIALERHQRWCFQDEPYIPIVSCKGEKDEFELKRKHVRRPIVFYVDFEALQVESDKKCPCGNVMSFDCGHNTKVCYEQQAFAYTIVVINDCGKVKDLIDYVGHDAANHFISDLLDLELKYQVYLEYKVPMALTEEEEEHFQNTNICHICEKPILPHHKKSRDHSHSTGRFVGASHSICNLQRKESEYFIPTIAHNMSSYDMHFIVASLQNHMTRIHRLQGIPLNSEKFKELTINSMRLKDSLSFLDGKLDSLVNTLVASKHEFKYLEQVFSTERRRTMVLRKGIYPYSWVRSIEQLHQQTVLPNRDTFYSELTGVTVSEEDYQYAKEVWDEFDCKNMIDYTRLYCVTDTILLCEVMERFRDTIHQKYSLDALNYISLPGLSRDIMMRVSRVRLDYMSDLSMINVIKRSIRGGLSYASLRHADIHEMEQKTGKKHTILYVDANSL